MLLAVIVAASSPPASGPDLTVGWGTATAALGLLAVAVSLNLANQRGTRRDLREVKHENLMCNWRQAVLIETMHASNIGVPAWIWQDPGDKVAKMNVEEQRSMARRLLDPFADHEREEGSVEWRAVLGYLSVILVLLVAAGFVLNRVVVQPIQRVDHTTSELLPAVRDLREIQANALAAQKAARAEREQTACVNSLTADYFVAIAAAFSSPPAPSAARDAAVRDLIVTAERIRNRVALCEDGDPADGYVPLAPPPQVPGIDTMAALLRSS